CRPMIDRQRFHLGLGTVAIAALCVVAAAGCNKSDEGSSGGAANPGGAPPAAQGPGRGPGGMGGPGGRMGGPGGRMGGPGGPMGGRDAKVAENATGSEIFQQKCQFCHGANGQGARGPALTNVGSKSNDDLHKIIHDGKNSGRMPAFGSQMTDA